MRCSRRTVTACAPVVMCHHDRCRGNMLHQLASVDSMDEQRRVADLPRTGSELANAVRIVLNIADDKESTVTLATFIHQATVRRDVGVELTQGAKSRSHRAYCKLEMAMAKSKAAALPEHGVPE